MPAQQEGGTLPAPDCLASPAPATAEEGATWQALLGAAIRDVDDLWRELALPPAALPAARTAAGAFRLLVPRGFVARMRRGDLADPLLRQVVPLGDEMAEFPGFTADPLAENGCAPVPGVLHKYAGRALLVTTGACAVHCRYCFRRHYPYEELPRGRRWWSEAVAWLQADASIHEVLLSGGDPLTLPDVHVADLITDLAAIPHLRRLRLHTRLPIVLPERVTDRLVEILAGCRVPVVCVVHANHPQELSPAVAAACRRLRDAGVTMLAQSVLLRGVNDDAGVLVDLSEGLFEAGVLPYYLHLLDRVQGAGHFLVPDDRAIALVRAAAARLPGYLVPRLVREEPGAAGKTPVFITDSSSETDPI